MNPQEYTRIASLEDHHAWYRGLHELILSNLRTHFPNPNATILDLGCGTGGFLSQLRDLYPQSYGTDLSTHALKYSKQRNLPNLIHGSAERLPFQMSSFDAITCLDVIYHQNISDDHTVIKECHRVLKPDGILMLHCPAFSFLHGAHDRVVYTRERYTRSILRQRLTQANFHILKASYRNTTTFPLILLKRLLSSQGSDLKPLPSLLNKVLLQVLKIENQILKHTSLPLGSSVFCIAQKSGEGQKD